ncbi:MAG: hypothetical protein ACU85V_20600, partial [Gammaproteobacteria bacterium]
MARAFFAWELGQGLGHLARLRPMMERLLARGHDVTLAARELANVHRVLGELPVTVLQAPLCRRELGRQELATQSFGQVLRNCGYHDADTLATLIAAWKHLMALVGAELVIVDHSPTAMLAAAALELPVIAFSSGFTHPPTGSPLGVFEPVPDASTRAGLLATDEALKANVNRALERVGGAPLDTLADLYGRADDVFLFTVPAFDHFGRRAGANYCGVVESFGDVVAPRWPGDGAPKLFAYLKPHPGLPQFLDLLARLRVNVLVYHNNLPAQLVERFDGDTMRFTREPVDLRAVAEQATLAVVNANLTTSFRLLTNGLPLLLVPLHAEQLLLVRRLAGTGAVGAARLDHGQALERQLRAMLGGSSYAEAARAFAASGAGGEVSCT